MDDLPVRKHIRLKNYDYSSYGYYFITICTKNRECLFGDISNNIMTLSDYGLIAENNIISIPEHIKNVRIDNYIVMPNHVHILLIVDNDDNLNVATRYIVSDNSDKSPIYTNNMKDERTPYMVSLQQKSKQIVPKTIQQYKASVSRNIGIAGLWQSKYHDHIIRNETEYQKIWQYIYENPIRWTTDKFYVI